MSPQGICLPDRRKLQRNPLGLRPPVSRRQFLKAGAISAAALGPLAALVEQSYAGELQRRFKKFRNRGGTKAGGAPLDPNLLMLLNRTTFGFSRDAYDEVATIGYNTYLERQLDPDTIDDSDMDARLAAYATLDLTSQEIRDTYDNDVDNNIPLLELMSASFERAVYSRRQLQERMVEFWTDHFNIYIADDLVNFLKTTDDRDVIRQHALGTFPDLLNASAHSAAMLIYLDNFVNAVGNAQENYARELMELHTLGVTGPYTEQDVQELARCLTGWTVYDSPMFGEFAFYEPFHDFGSKTVLGTSIPAGGGESDALTVLDILAYHPSTARFISQKMCTHFLGYNPAEDIVESVKATYLATGGDIKEMLRVILAEPILTYRATPKLKRPFHQLAALLRATGANATINEPPGYPYLFALLSMGQLPFYWQPPNGYPDALDAWVNSQLPRWQSASWFFDGVLASDVDLDALILSEGGVPGEEAASIDRILTGGMMSADEVAQLQQFYDDLPPADSGALSDTFGLAASMPGSQWY